MATKCCVEISLDTPRYDEQSYAQGYGETLENCEALAVILLQKALTGEDVKRCWDCSNWIGRCTKGKIWCLARDEACREFSPKK